MSDSFHQVDSEDSTIQKDVGAQTDAIHRHKQEVTGFQHLVPNDRVLVSIRERLQRLHVLNPAACEPRLPPPEIFSGRPEECKPFLVKCSLVFELQPSSFSDERAKVAFIISRLTGRALQWAAAEWDRASPICASVKLFAEELRKIFDHTATGREAGRRLLQLTQGGARVRDYMIQFKTLAVQSHWNSEALCDVYYHGLADHIKDNLATRELPESLDDLVSLTIQIDQRLWERCEERRAAGKAESVRVRRAKLTSEERKRRQQNKLCLYCGQEGHFVATCMLKYRGHQ